MTYSKETTTKPRIAIIGAGLAGCTLALQLQKYDIACKIFELRADKYSVGGSISLHPNGLRVLEAVGVYQKIRPQGFSMEYVNFHNLDSGHTSQEGKGISEAYGYKSLRISRQILIKELRAAIPQRGIEIEYGFRFSHVVSEDEQSVTFAAADGTTYSASLLVGADGIHSKVRQHISDLEPEYTGMLGLATTIPRSALRFPSDPGEAEAFEPPFGLRGMGDMISVVPCNFDGSELALMRGAFLPGRSREEWEELYADKQASRDLFCRKLKDGFPEIGRSAIEVVTKENEFIYWPVHQLPRLESWTSNAGKVVLLGDAAHAVPPTTGQGSNQAFEDAYMLGEVLGRAEGRISEESAVSFWHKKRKERVYSLIDRLLTKAEGKDPIELRGKKVKGQGENERGDAWLYGLDLEGEVDVWLKGTAS